jgi:mRNA-degrading endonuclease RelE of RelBE toxin-antitoxin system
MRYDMVLAPGAVDDFKRLRARERAMIRDVIETHLRYEPQKISTNRIKRLRGMTRPEYRLRGEGYRIFCDVKEKEVEILAIVPKSTAAGWLERYGEEDENDSAFRN